MSLTIKQATWGDESSARDITKSIQKLVKDGSYLDITAGSHLVPSVTLNPNVANLTDDDKKDIKDEATKKCQGNANDTACIALQSANLEATLLQTKIAEQNSSANIINGRRLTLDIVDGNGNEQTVMIPDGQEFKAGQPTSGNTVVKPKPVDGEAAPSTMSTILSYLTTGSGYLFTVLLTILWAFSIVVTYRVLVLAGHVMAAYILTALAIVIPYSGLVTTPIAMAVYYYLENQ
jgi:hypothetical protein